MIKIEGIIEEKDGGVMVDFRQFSPDNQPATSHEADMADDLSEALKVVATSPTRPGVLGGEVLQEFYHREKFHRPNLTTVIVVRR